MNSMMNLVKLCFVDLGYGATKLEMILPLFPQKRNTKRSI